MLTLPKLKSHIQQKLIPHGYAVASFGKPRLEEDVTIILTATDERERTSFTSKKEFRKTLNECVKGTNWELVKTSVQEKVGALKARLKSFDQRRQVKL